MRTAILQTGTSAISRADPGDIVVVRLMYQWPVYVSLLGLNLADLAGSKRLLIMHQPHSATSPINGGRIMSRFRLSWRAARGRLRRLPGDKRGVSAVEFAMLLPLMLTLYLGGGRSVARRRDRS